MARKKELENGKQVLLYLDVPVVKKARRIATAKDLSFSRYVNKLLERELKREERKVATKKATISLEPVRVALP